MGHEEHRAGLFSGIYYCPICHEIMQFEDEVERDDLICPHCGCSEDLDHYGYTDEEYDALYPSMEEVLGIEPEFEEGVELYEEVYNELDD